MRGHAGLRPYAMRSRSLCLPVGTVTTGKMLSALKALGFSHCWDTEFAADVTIWEEASEFVERLGRPKRSSPVHILLPRLAEIRRNVLPGTAAAFFVLQVSHRHERCAGEDLRRAADAIRSQGHLYSVHHAMYRKKIRRIASGTQFQRTARHRRHSDDP